ncbi:MAG: acetyl esterase/lipase [Myxococcota bacterium]
MFRVLVIAGVVALVSACRTFDDQHIRNTECQCRVQVPWDWGVEESRTSGRVLFDTGLVSHTTASVQWISKRDRPKTRSLSDRLDGSFGRYGAREAGVLIEDSSLYSEVDGYLTVQRNGQTYNGDVKRVRVIDMPDAWLVAEVSGESEDEVRDDFYLLTRNLHRGIASVSGSWERFQGVSSVRPALSLPSIERLEHRWEAAQTTDSGASLCFASPQTVVEMEPETGCSTRIHVFGASEVGAVLIWVPRLGERITAATMAPFTSAGATVVALEFVGDMDWASVLGPRLDDVMLAIDSVPLALDVEQRPLYLGGEGAGGGVALMAAVERPTLAGVVLLDPLVDVGPDATLAEDVSARMASLDERSERFALRSAIRYASGLLVPTLVVTAEWSIGGIDGERLDASAYTTNAPLVVHRIPQTDATTLRRYAFDAFSLALSAHPEPVTNALDAEQVQRLGHTAGVAYRQRLKQDLLTQMAPILRVGQEYDWTVRTRVSDAMTGLLSRPHLSDLMHDVVVEATVAKERSEVAWPQVTDFDRLQTAFVQADRRGVYGPSTPEDCEYHGLAEAMHLYEAADQAARVGVAFYHVPAVERALAGGPLRVEVRAPSTKTADRLAVLAILTEELANAGLTATKVPGLEAVDIAMQWQRRLNDDFWDD